MATVTFFFRKDENGSGVSSVVTKDNDDSEPTNNIFEFIKTYPMFMLFLLGAAL